MKQQLELSEKDYWKSTLQLVDATLSMLSAFDGRHIEVIDTAIDSLRKILAMGDNLDVARVHPQQQKQENKTPTTVPSYNLFNGIANDDQYQRHLQTAIMLSIQDYNISQSNAHLSKDNLQNKQSPERNNVNAEYDDEERQFARDTETATKLSLEHVTKKKKTHETDIHGGAPAPAPDQRDNLSITKSEDLVRTPPTLENDDKLDTKATKPKAEPPGSPFAHLVFPTVSAPVPVRHNVPAVLQAQEQILINERQYQPKASQATSHQKQLSYQTLQQYRQQAHQQQKLQRQYQQEHLPQPVKFTPRGDDYLTTEIASESSTESISPVIATKTATGFEGKPCKMKAFNDLQNCGVYYGGQQRIFEWINKSGGGASWERFASSADTTWKQGVDIEVAEWEKEEAKTSKSPTSPQGKQVVASKNASCLIDPSTCKYNDRISIEDDEAQDNWTKEEERHDSMTIAISRNPLRKPKRLRILRPDDGDFESSDDEEEENDTND